MGYGFRILPCQTQTSITVMRMPRAVHMEREIVAILPALQCAGTGSRHRIIAIDPMIGYTGYMYDISSSTILAAGLGKRKDSRRLGTSPAAHAMRSLLGLYACHRTIAGYPIQSCRRLNVRLCLLNKWAGAPKAQSRENGLKHGLKVWLWSGS